MLSASDFSMVLIELHVKKPIVYYSSRSGSVTAADVSYLGSLHQYCSLYMCSSHICNGHNLRLDIKMQSFVDGVCCLCTGEKVKYNFLSPAERNELKPVRCQQHSKVVWYTRR